MQLPFTYAGQSFTVQAQKLILNVYDFFKRNKRDPRILRRLGTPQETAGKILNVSSCVIGKIQKRFQTTGRIEVPGKTRRKFKRILDNVDQFKEQMIRETVKELTAKRFEKLFP
jgi:transposase